MKALIIYATVEGQTRKIAETAAKNFEDLGWNAALMNVAEPAEFALERPDAVLLMAPVHANDYPSDFREFVKQEADWLNSVPSAFVSVSLSIHSEFEDERDAVLVLPEALSVETGWKPKSVHHAAGALKFTEYDFFKRFLVRYISTREAKSVDGKQDYEFTNWDALKAFVTDFSGNI